MPPGNDDPNPSGQTGSPGEGEGGKPGEGEGEGGKPSETPDTLLGGDGTPGDGGSSDGDGSSGETSGDGSGPPPASVVPDSYDLKAPEDFELPEGAMEKFTESAKDLGLSNEQAQKLLDREIALSKEYRESSQTQIREQIIAWGEQVRSDPEIGGERFDRAMHDARSALDKLGTDSLKQLLKESGYGSHPEVVRLFSKIGGMLREDDTLLGSSPKPRPTEKSTEEKLYPSMFGGEKG